MTSRGTAVSPTIRVLLFGFAAAFFCVLWPAQFLPVDFAAFYCGGDAVGRQADPYGMEPVQACEQSALGVFHKALFRGEVVPAPFPFSTLGFFALFALLPALPAFLLWTALNIAAYIAMIAALRRITVLPVSLLIACTAIPELYVALSVGQMTPLVLGAMTLTAAAFAAGRPLAAAAAVMVTLLEPHLGLPAWIALFACERRSRPALLAASGLLLGFTLGSREAIAWMREYVSVVVPSHARSELFHDGQYSLSHLLAVLGLPARLALTAAGVEYAGMIVFGLLVARALATSAKLPVRALAIITVPAFASFGGTFIHVQQMAVFTLAACLLVAARDGAASRRGVLPGIAIVCLALPLSRVAAQSEAPLYALVAAVIFFALADDAPGQAVVAAAATFAAVAAAFNLIAGRSSKALSPSEFEPMLLHAHTPGSNVEAVWQRFSELHFSWLGPYSVVLELPLLVAAGYVLAGIISLALTAQTHPMRPRDSTGSRHAAARASRR